MRRRVWYRPIGEALPRFRAVAVRRWYGWRVIWRAYDGEVQAGCCIGALPAACYSPRPPRRPAPVRVFGAASSVAAAR